MVPTRTSPFSRACNARRSGRPFPEVVHLTTSRGQPCFPQAASFAFPFSYQLPITRLTSSYHAPHHIDRQVVRACEPLTTATLIKVGHNSTSRHIHMPVPRPISHTLLHSLRESRCSLARDPITNKSKSNACRHHPLSQQARSG